MDHLAASPRTETLIRLERVRSNRTSDRFTALERCQVIRRVNGPIPPPLRRPPRGWHIEQPELLRAVLRRSKPNPTAHRLFPPRQPQLPSSRSLHETSAILGRMRPEHPRAATRLRPIHAERVANRPFFVRDLSRSCAGLSPAQRDFSRSFASDLLSGGGGNRTRVRRRSDRASTSLSSALISSGDRLAGGLPPD